MEQADLSISTADMAAIAERLAGSAGELRGHAATVAAATIPASAFGAGAAVAAEYEQLRQSLAERLHAHATTVDGHHAFVREVSGAQAGIDGSAGSVIGSVDA